MIKKRSIKTKMANHRFLFRIWTENPERQEQQMLMGTDWRALPLHADDSARDYRLNVK